MGMLMWQSLQAAHERIAALRDEWVVDLRTLLSAQCANPFPRVVLPGARLVVRLLKGYTGLVCRSITRAISDQEVQVAFSAVLYASNIPTRSGGQVLTPLQILTAAVDAQFFSVRERLVQKCEDFFNRRHLAACEEHRSSAPGAAHALRAAVCT